jgi:signal peptidase II
LLLRSGISVLLGGILGNVADRTIYGYVIDFIVIRAPIVSSAAFNLADALQWVGYAMISTSLIRESEVLWPTENTRKSLWVNPRFQLRYCFILMAVGVGFATIAGVFSYTFLRITIIEFAGAHPKILDNYLQPFLLAFIAVTLTFLAILFVVGRSLSARIAGPFYAFELFLDDLMTRKARPLRLRSGDEFRNLEQIADRIMTEMTRLSREAEAAKTEQKRDPYPDSDD